MSKNDNKILELKKQIQEKKSKLKKIKRFNPITTCNLPLNGITHNIHVCPIKDLKLLLIQLNMFNMSAHDLDMLDQLNDISLGGFRIDEWMTDIQTRLECLTVKEEENKLKVMEEKLTKLLSEEKKTELELQEMESWLEG